MAFNSSTASRKAQALIHKLRQEMPNASGWEIVQAFEKAVSDDESLKGLQYPDGNVTEDWLCIDCGVNTAPGMLDGKTIIEHFNAGAKVAPQQKIGPDSEVYMVRDVIWKKAGMEPFGGCLCIECLERRLGRKLKPKDFDWNHEFNAMPGSQRLLKRQKCL
jgi:hypothetical protein